MAALANTRITFLSDGYVIVKDQECWTARQVARILVPIAKNLKFEAEYRAECRSERRAMGLY